jgi:hypothetical protein
MGEGEGGATFDGFIIFIWFGRWTGIGGTYVRPLTGRALQAVVPYSNHNACTAVVNILIKTKKQIQCRAPRVSTKPQRSTGGSVISGTRLSRRDLQYLENLVRLNGSLEILRT